MIETIAMVGGMIFTAATGGSLLWLGIRGAKPRLRYRWQGPPTVRISDTFDQSRISEVCDAVSAWRVQGAIIGQLKFGGPPIAETREILLVGRTQSYSARHAGETAITHVDRMIVHAVCSLPDGSDYMVIAHEIGHAIGFGHVSKRGHIMTSSTARGGLSFQGCSDALSSS